MAYERNEDSMNPFELYTRGKEKIAQDEAKINRRMFANMWEGTLAAYGETHGLSREEAAKKFSESDFKVDYNTAKQIAKNAQDLVLEEMDSPLYDFKQNLKKKLADASTEKEKLKYESAIEEIEAGVSRKTGIDINQVANFLEVRGAGADIAARISQGSAQAVSLYRTTELLADTVSYDDADKLITESDELASLGMINRLDPYKSDPRQKLSLAADFYENQKNGTLDDWLPTQNAAIRADSDDLEAKLKGA